MFLTDREESSAFSASKRTRALQKFGAAKGGMRAGRLYLG